MIVKLVATDEILAFSTAPVINKSLDSGGSTLQIEVGSMFTATNSSGTCFAINQESENGYPFNSLALPFEIIAETQLGERLFRGFFEEYTTKYNKDNITSTLTFRDCSRFLERSPLVGTYRNTFETTLLTLINQCEEPAPSIFLPVIYNTGTTKALQCIKRINFVTPPVAGDIVIVGQKRYKYVVEAPTTDSELNIETNLATMAVELAGKLNAGSASECTAEVQGNSVVITGILYNNNVLVYTDGTRITNEILQDASASDETGTVISVLDLHVNLVLDGGTLRSALETLCPLAQCNFYVDVKYGNLVIYQPSYLQENITSLRTLDASDGSLLCLDSQGIITDLSYKDNGSGVNRVIVWGRNGETPLPDLRLEDQHVTVTTTNTIKHDIPVDSTVLDYEWDKTADRVLQVKITPKMTEPVEGSCYNVPVDLVLNEDFDSTTTDINRFSASTLNLATTPDVEIVQSARFSLDLTDVPTDMRALPNYIKLVGIIDFDTFLESGETYDAEVDFYLYDPDENILLEQVSTEIVYANHRFIAEKIVSLDNYKGQEIEIKGILKTTTNISGGTVSLYLFGGVHCLRCDEIPVVLQEAIGDSLVSSITSGSPYTANRFLAITFADIQSTELNFPSESTETTFKIDLRDPVYFSGIPYIALTEILDTSLGFGSVNAETTLYINSTEISHRETSTINADAITYNSNVSLEAYIDEEIEVLIMQNAVTADHLPTRSLVTVQVAGIVGCLYPEMVCPTINLVSITSATGTDDISASGYTFTAVAGDNGNTNSVSAAMDVIFQIDLTHPDLFDKSLTLNLSAYSQANIGGVAGTVDYNVDINVRLRNPDNVTIVDDSDSGTFSDADDHLVTIGVGYPTSYMLDLTPYIGNILNLSGNHAASIASASSSIRSVALVLSGTIDCVQV